MRQAVEHGILLFCTLAIGALGGIGGWSQSLAGGVPTPGAEADPAARTPSDSLIQWEGSPVRHIRFDGVSVERLAPLPGHLAQAEGAPLSGET